MIVMNKLLSLILFAFIFFIYPTQAQAQSDTFGPICEQGTTCTPSPSQIPITQLPRTGPIEYTIGLMGVGVVLALTGTGSVLSYLYTKKG